MGNGIINQASKDKPYKKKNVQIKNRDVQTFYSHKILPYKVYNSLSTNTYICVYI